MKNIEEAQALTNAIRAFTQEAPGEEPSGPREAAIEALRFALARGDMKNARRYFRDMCEHSANDVQSLCVAAEGYFGGNFRRGMTLPPAPVAADDDDGPDDDVDAGVDGDVLAGEREQ